MYICDRRTLEEDCKAEATHEVREHGRVMGRCCIKHARELDEVIDGLELVRIKYLAASGCFEGEFGFDCVRILKESDELIGKDTVKALVPPGTVDQACPLSDTLPADVAACFEGALSHDCIQAGEDEERGTIGTCEEDWT